MNVLKLNKNLLDLKYEHISNEPMKVSYTIIGRPVPLARPRLSNSYGKAHVWDCQAESKRNSSLYLAKDHGENPPFPQKPLELIVKFYFKPPKKLKATIKNELLDDFCVSHNGDLDNLIKYVLDTMQTTMCNDFPDSTIILDDCYIASIKGSKLWGLEERSEITLLELK
jgi:Holliday junction resolvase RusA-like endonuclease